MEPMRLLRRPLEGTSLQGPADLARHHSAILFRGPPSGGAPPLRKIALFSGGAQTRSSDLFARSPQEAAFLPVSVDSPIPLITLAMAILLLIGMRRFQELVSVVSAQSGLALMFQRPASIPGVFLMAAQRVTPGRVASLLERGRSSSWIAKRFGLHRTTVPRMIARAREGTPLFRHKRPEGAPHPSQKADLTEIRRVLSETWGNVMQAARRLKMRRNSLEKRILGEDLDQWVAQLRKAGAEARCRAAAAQKELVRERAAQDLTKSATLAARRPPRPSPNG